MEEVIQLRQDHLRTVQKMDALNQQMLSAEVRQKQMVSFLAKVLQNPEFLGHVKQLNEQREIASPRIRRRFLTQQQKQQQAGCGISDNPIDQQIVKYGLGICDASATDSLPLDSGGSQDLLGGSRDTEDKGKRLLTSDTGAGFLGSDYFLSLPNDVIPEEIRDIPPAEVVISKPEPATTVSKGKDVIDLEIDAAVALSVGENEYLKLVPDKISQERMFPDAMDAASDFVSEEGAWNIGFEAGGSSLSSGHAVWGSLGDYQSHEMEAAAGSCSLWDLGLHNLEEDLDIDKYVGGDSSLQEQKYVERQLNEDCPRASAP